MVIGVLQFELLIHDASSLKDKRRVVQSVKDRLHREHLVAIAEVAHQDKLNIAVLAVAAVGSEGRRVGEVLDAIDAKLRTLRDGELASTSRSILHEPVIEADEGLDPGERERLRREMLSMMDEEGRT
jgi:uncharacterized protein YlxP (DUF503 family)